MSLKFSLVTPSFNQVKFVDKTLSSIREQSILPFEHIILDGGSTDGTLEILRKHADQNNYVDLVIGEDKNQTDAINIGFSRAKGDIITWLNTDDVYENSRVIETVINIFEKDPSVDIIYGKGKFYDVNNEFVKDVFIHQDSNNLKSLFMTGVGILQPALFMRRKVFDTLGELDDTLQYSMDYDYWLKACFSNCKFRFIDEYFARAILHEDSKTVGSRVKQLEETCELVKKYYNFYPVQWLQKLFAANNYDVDGLRENRLDIKDDTKLDEYFNSFNKTKSSLEAMLSHDSISKGSLSRSKAYREMFSRDRFFFATAFNSGFFESGLTLLNTLKNSFSSLTVVVYDLGLELEERNLIRNLEFAVLLDYPHEDKKYFNGYFEPHTYGFKVYSISHMNDITPAGSSYLWIDAGIVPNMEPERAFSIIEENDIFLVDHDDKPGWPFYNLTMITDSALKHFHVSNENFIKPHLRAGIIGFKAKGKYKNLITEAFNLSLDERVLVGEKHPSSEEKVNQSFGAVRDKLIDNPKEANTEQFDKLRSIFGYWGHRHDQAIFSVLASKYKAPYQSAIKFCFAPDISSEISKQRWKGGDVQKTRENSLTLDDLNESSESAFLQHRGLYLNYDDLFNNSHSETKTALIMGNGPSLAGWDFHRFDNLVTFGMNAAYRYWDEIKWYPDYYICLDLVVGLSHKEEIKRLIVNSDQYGIKRFLLRRNLVDELNGCINFDKVICFDDFHQKISPFNTEFVTTGSHCLAWAVNLGFINIGIIGVDCNYIELVSGSAAVGGMELEIKDDSKDNPNYFFAGYQKKGDKYNIPNPGGDIHLEAWRQVKEKLEREKKVTITNLNYRSKIDCFPFGKLSGKEYKTVVDNDIYLIFSAVINEVGNFADSVLISSDSENQDYLDAIEKISSASSDKSICRFDNNLLDGKIHEVERGNTLYVMVNDYEIVLAKNHVPRKSSEEQLIDFLSIANEPKAVKHDINENHFKIYFFENSKEDVVRQPELISYCARVRNRLNLLRMNSEERIRQQGVKFTYVKQQPESHGTDSFTLLDNNYVWMLFKGHIYLGDTIFCKVDITLDESCDISLSLKRHGKGKFEEKKVFLSVDKGCNKSIFIKKQFSNHHQGVSLQLELTSSLDKKVTVKKFNAQCYQILGGEGPNDYEAPSVKEAQLLYQQGHYEDSLLAYMGLSKTISENGFDYNIYKCLGKRGNVG